MAVVAVTSLWTPGDLGSNSLVTTFYRLLVKEGGRQAVRLDWVIQRVVVVVVVVVIVSIFMFES